MQKGEGIRPKIFFIQRFDVQICFVSGKISRTQFFWTKYPHPCHTPDIPTLLFNGTFDYP